MTDNPISIGRLMCLAAAATAVAAAPAAAVELPVPAPAAPAEVEPRVEVQAEVQAEAEASAPAPPEAMPWVAPQAGNAYLGVGGAEIPELLAIHLGLQAGEGLVIRTLDPAGPAAGAGIEENDLLLKLDGKPVSSHLELREAVVARAPGDEVELELIHQGKPLKKTVILGTQPAGAAAMPGLPGMFDGLPEEQARRVREAIEQNLRAFEEAVPDARERQLPEAMRQLEKRMEFMFRGLGGLGDLGGDGGPAARAENSATIRMADAQGSVELQSKDGGKQIRVRDNDGNIQWEGPWDTDQDKAAAPDDIRERIERLNFGMVEDNPGGGLRLKIRPNRDPEPIE